MTPLRRVLPLLLIASLTMTLQGCRQAPAVLTLLMDARQTAADLRLQFARAAEASSQAVMADTDDAATAASRDAEASTARVAQDTAELDALLEQLSFTSERGMLEAFRTCFTEYGQIEAEILALAVENSNIKAQRLAFGPARESLEQFQQSLDRVARTAAADRPLDALTARATIALLEVAVMQPRHIAEADNAVMTQMEQQMTASEAAARSALTEIRRRAGAMNPDVIAATVALDRFTAHNRDIITLSRRNSEVRSLALTLGRKRTVAAQCEDQLRQIEESLMTHEFTGTR